MSKKSKKEQENLFISTQQTAQQQTVEVPNAIKLNLNLENIFSCPIYKRWQKNQLISEMPVTWNPENDFYQSEQNDEFSEFRRIMLSYWDKNLTVVFTKKRDIQIADAVLELFRRADYIENFNKKHLYLLIREMTDCKTHYITKVVNTMKQHQKKMLNQFLDGQVIDETLDNEFWTEDGY